MTGPTHDNPKVGPKNFEHANSRTFSEYNQEQKMGTKTRIKTLYEMRNGLPMASLGDKHYKLPDYTPGFFQEGGLIAGSS